MDADQSDFPQPDRDLRIWRYMDLAKYLAMLVSGALHFTRADRFQDPFEGLSSRVYHDQKLATNPEHLRGLPKLPENLEELHLNESSTLDAILQAYRKSIYICSWHANEHESAAMWKLFGPSKETIAVESTYESLRGSLPGDFHLGQVSYVDYDRASLPFQRMFLLHMVKRASFAHEREVRALTWQLPDGMSFAEFMRRHGELEIPEGFHQKVDLRKLIRRVHVSPESQPWFRDLVDEISARLGFDFDVNRSSLYDSPLA